MRARISSSEGASALVADWGSERARPPRPPAVQPAACNNMKNRGKPDHPHDVPRWDSSDQPPVATLLAAFIVAVLARLLSRVGRELQSRRNRDGTTRIELRFSVRHRKCRGKPSGSTGMPRTRPASCRSFDEAGKCPDPIPVFLRQGVELLLIFERAQPAKRGDRPLADGLVLRRVVDFGPDHPRSFKRSALLRDQRGHDPHPGGRPGDFASCRGRLPTPRRIILHPPVVEKSEIARQIPVLRIRGDPALHELDGEIACARPRRGEARKEKSRQSGRRR